MRHVLLILLLPFQLFAQEEGRSSASPLNVRIHKKTAQGELLVRGVDQGSAKHPIRLVVSAKCGPAGKWKTFKNEDEGFPANVCYLFEERQGDWNEGLQTLKISFFRRVEKTEAPKTIEDGEFGPCEKKLETVISLRDICAQTP